MDLKALMLSKMKMTPETAPVTTIQDTVDTFGFLIGVDKPETPKISPYVDWKGGVEAELCFTIFPTTWNTFLRAKNTIYF